MKEQYQQSDKNIKNNKNKEMRLVALVLLIAVMTAFAAACAKRTEPDLTAVGGKVTKATGEERYKTVTAAPKEETTVPQTTKPSEETTLAVPIIKSETTEAAPVTQENGELAKTGVPTITGVTNTAPAVICIAGTCEPNSKIYIRGGVKEVSYVSDDKYFIGTVEVPTSGTTALTVSARALGKAESDGVEVKGTYKAGAKQIRTDVFEVVVGNGYQCHFVSALPDYLGTNLLTDSQKDKLKSAVKSNASWLKTNMGGAELIYLVIPNPMTVYPESVPSQYLQYGGEGRREQFKKAASDGGAVVIDLTDAFIAHKNDDFKLFHKTDSHWTEYGAWLAYTELMNYIAQKYPDAKPRTFDEMGFYKKDVNGGDMPYYLELDETKVRELAVFAAPKFETPANMLYFKSKNDLMMNHDTTPKEAVYTTDRANLPNVYVMRDSFGIAIYNMLSERFNKMTYKAMWSYNFDKSDIQKSGANYVVYVVAERNLGELLY